MTIVQPNRVCAFFVFALGVALGAPADAQVSEQPVQAYPWPPTAAEFRQAAAAPAPDPPPPSIPKSIGHHKEWLQACKGDPTSTLCNFDYSGRLIQHNLLGAVAHRVGKKLIWDNEKFEAVGMPEANQFINKEYRAGWEFEA